MLETVDLDLLKKYGGNKLNMTLLALNLSNYVNWCCRSKNNSAKMFSGYEIHAVTNGVRGSFP